jgi:hypothetical protein
MRTAICLHGLSLGRNTLRDITRSNPDNDWKRFTKTILSNLIENNNADVFIHTWEHDEINQIINVYKPKLILSEPQRSFNPFFSNEILNIDKEDFGLYMRNGYNPLIYTHPRIFSYTYSFDRSDSLRQSYELQHGFKYDYVIKMRFDMQILKPINVTKFDANKIQLGKWWGGHPKAIEELLIICNSSNMKNISSLYHKMYEYLVDDEYNNIIRSSGLGAYHFSSPHEIFYHHFYKENLLHIKEEIFEREVDFTLDRKNFNFSETNKDI